MSRYDAIAWLGDFATYATDEQIDTLTAAFARVDDRYPEDFPGEMAGARGNAASGAGYIVLGDATLAELADAWSRARAVERAAMETLTGALIASAELGMSEMDMQRATGLNRGTIRKAVGK